jgi:hypothetical protein
MRKPVGIAVVFALAHVLTGCGSRTTPNPHAATRDTATTPPVEDATPGFVGKTWRVTESSNGTPGTRYEFRADGVLLMSSPGSTPAEGRWTWEQGVLTMIEEDISYRTDILALDDSTFRIRSHNPGQPVEMKLVRENHSE